MRKRENYIVITSVFWRSTFSNKTYNSNMSCHARGVFEAWHCLKSCQKNSKNEQEKGHEMKVVLDLKNMSFWVILFPPPRPKTTPFWKQFLGLFCHADSNIHIMRSMQLQSAEPLSVNLDVQSRTEPGVLKEVELHYCNFNRPRSLSVTSIWLPPVASILGPLARPKIPIWLPPVASILRPLVTPGPL